MSGNNKNKITNLPIRGKEKKDESFSKQIPGIAYIGQSINEPSKTCGRQPLKN